MYCFCLERMDFRCQDKMSGVENCGECALRMKSLLTSQQYPLIINNLQQKCQDYALQNR